ncbi:MAG: polysaccharide biosynthesis tyrosine autokinase [Dyadobacter sp.]|uniref:GumC family protein n=1 Tax=Dyadobacter sp. TaxID=1914288 RepID=UPI003264F024
MKEQYLSAITSTGSSTDTGVLNVRLLREIARNWYWFLSSLLVCFAAAFVFLRYTTPEYKISASLLIRDDSRGTDFGDAALLESIGLSNGQSSVDNEVQVLKSRTLIEKVVNDLQLFVQYYAVGQVKTTELYDKSPLRLRLLNPEYNRERSFTYHLHQTTNNGYHLIVNAQRISGYFGDTILLPHGRAILTKTAYRPALDDNYHIVITAHEESVKKYSSALTISAPNKLASVVHLTLNEILPVKGELVVRQLIKDYLAASIADKNRISDSTLVFIDVTLKAVSKELIDIEKHIESYRQTHRLTDMDENVRLLLQDAGHYNRDGQNQAVRLKIVASLLKYINENPDHLVPSSLYLNDPQFTSLAEKYNEIQLLKEKALVAATESHPIIKTLDVQLTSLRADLNVMIASQKRELEVNIASLNQYNAAYSAQLDQIPSRQRVLLEYSRQQQIKQELYLFLLKKRVETSISKSATIANARVIDSPKADPAPIKPNRQLVLLISGFLGLGFPLVTLHLKDILNTRITGKAEILQHCDIPVLAEIGHQNKRSKLQDNIITEQFRVLRTNIQFLAPTETCRKILLTSAVGGEGKSFTAAHLAHSFAMTGKKVILLELDLRKPRLADSMKLLAKGFTDFMIAGGSLTHYIQAVGTHYPFAVLTCGPSPPNPAEMLSLPKVTEMMAWLTANYDVIIMDTPPIGLVTDARLLAQHADLSLFIIRQRFTHKHQLKYIQELSGRQQLPGLSLVINDIEALPGYGYGYYERKQPLRQLFGNVKKFRFLT